VSLSYLMYDISTKGRVSAEYSVDTHLSSQLDNLLNSQTNDAQPLRLKRHEKPLEGSETA
jgi:hypothetical protein